MLLFSAVVKMLWILLLTSLISCTRSDKFSSNTDGCGRKIPLQTLITNQSSDYKHENITYYSKRAIDGNISTCAHTSNEGIRFWTIDLKYDYNISCVCINNTDEVNTDITKALISVGNKCVSIQSFQEKQLNCLHLPEGELAHNVTVKSLNETPTYVVLCEVTIWVYGESHFILIKENKTWEHALYYCRDNHRDLASILNQQDQAWVEIEAREAHTPYVWLGLRYTCTLGFWFWIQNYKLEYENFAENIKGCDMSVAMGKEDGKWYTEPDNQTYNFICTK